MDALGLAAGMSYARNWVGKVDWYIDNMGVINNYRRVHRWVANDWSGAGDRDANGYINALRRRVKGECAVHHQLGHVEKRKKYKRKVPPWTMTEWGNWIADGIAGSARKMAEKEKEWVAQVDKWNAEVDRRERLGGVTKEVAKPVQARAVPLMPARKWANIMQWVLCWEDLEVTDPAAAWVRKTVQNACSTY
jgi:hypothetical protein